MKETDLTQAPPHFPLIPGDVLLCVLVRENLSALYKFIEFPRGLVPFPLTEPQLRAPVSLSLIQSGAEIFPPILAVFTVVTESNGVLRVNFPVEALLPPDTLLSFSVVPRSHLEDR